jgi:undecaprenyl-diphosphatase
MSTVEAVILAIVEGLTEYLPISSTGHMIIAQALLHVQETSFVKVYLINIQFGAILAVLVLYFNRFVNIKTTQQALGLLFQIGNKEKRDELIHLVFVKNDFYVKIFIAFIPAAIIGFLFNKKIEALLESVNVVATSLIIGGIVIIISDYIFKKQIEGQSEPDKESVTYIDEFGIERQRELQPSIRLNYFQAIIVGLFQTVAMVPGVSRSAATIIGGLTQRLTMRQAAEFSFFLAVPTITAAAALKTFQHLEDIHGTDMDSLILGNIIAFVVAMVAIKYFVNYISQHGMKVFGYYRIILGILILLSPYIFHVTLHISK